MNLPTDSPEENKTLAIAQSRQATTRSLPGSRLDDSVTSAAAQADAPVGDLASTPARDRKPVLTSVTFSIASRTKWYTAFKNILPIYIGIHLAFFALSCLTVLYTFPAFSDRKSVV